MIILTYSWIMYIFALEMEENNCSLSLHLIFALLKLTIDNVYITVL